MSTGEGTTAARVESERAALPCKTHPLPRHFRGVAQDVKSRIHTSSSAVGPNATVPSEVRSESDDDEAWACASWARPSSVSPSASELQEAPTQLRRLGSGVLDCRHGPAHPCRMHRKGPPRAAQSGQSRGRNSSSGRRPSWLGERPLLGPTSYEPSRSARRFISTPGVYLSGLDLSAESRGRMGALSILH
jgi:hypothetical protein